MRTLYYTSDTTTAKFLVEIKGKVFLVNYWRPGDKPLTNPVTELLSEEGDNIDMVCSRFFKFTMEEWNTYGPEDMDYETVCPQLEIILNLK